MESERKDMPHKLYNMTIRLMDTGLPYPNKESAEQDATEWAQSIADSENCMIVDVVVEEAV
jgi:hypothetical protein